MPAPVAPLLGFVIGTALAWSAADELARRQSSLQSQAMLVAALFGLLVFAPIAVFFIALAPDWAYAYYVNSEKIPRVAELGLVLLDVASVPLGFAAAGRAASLRHLSGVVRVAVVPGALAAIAILVCARRLAVHASYRQYHGDFGTQPIAGSPLGYALLWMLIVLVAAAAWTVHCLRQMGSQSTSKGFRK